MQSKRETYSHQHLEPLLHCTVAEIKQKKISWSNWVSLESHLSIHLYTMNLNSLENSFLIELNSSQLQTIDVQCQIGETCNISDFHQLSYSRNQLVWKAAVPGFSRRTDGWHVYLYPCRNDDSSSYLCSILTLLQHS